MIWLVDPNLWGVVILVEPYHVSFHTLSSQATHL